MPSMARPASGSGGVRPGRINETAVTPIPGTDLILFTRDLGDKSRLEAVDLLSGESIWQSDKVKGDVMQLAVDPANDLVAVVLVKDARGSVGSELKRKPVIHVLKLSTGDELWKRDLEDEIEMMPARFSDGEVAFTLDNYRAPLILDGRLYLFYDGSTSYDALTGKEKQREKFKINEDGLALTEADPVVDAAEHLCLGPRPHSRLSTDAPATKFGRPTTSAPPPKWSRSAMSLLSEPADNLRG